MYSHLDQKDKASVEGKLKTFTEVYKNITGKQVVFEFPTTE